MKAEQTKAGARIAKGNVIAEREYEGVKSASGTGRRFYTGLVACGGGCKLKSNDGLRHATCSLSSH